MTTFEGTSETSAGQAPAASAGDSIAPLRKLVKSSGIYALSSVASPLVTLALAPFLTHALSPTDYGILAVLNTLIGLGAGITQLGLGSAFFRAYGYDYTASKDRRYVLGTMLLILFSVSLAASGGAAILAPALANLLFGRSSLSSLLVLTAGVIFLQNLTVPGFAWLCAESRALFYALLSIGNVVITLFANIFLVGVLHLGLTGSILASGCGYASVMLCTLPLILLHAALKIRADIARNLLSFGLPLVISFICSWVLQLSDRYLLSIFSSLAETAKYAVAYTLGSAIAVVVLGPFTLAWPTATFAIARREDAAQVFKVVFRWFSLFLLFAAFGLALVGRIVLDWFFPVAYHAEFAVIPIVALSLAFYATSFVFGIGVPLTRKTWIGIIFTTAAALVNVALNLVLIPRFGAMGAAVSTLLAYVVLATMAYVVGRRIYPVQFETGIFLIALLIGAAFYVGSEIVGRGFGTYAGWGIATGALILYTGCLILLGMFPTRGAGARAYLARLGFRRGANRTSGAGEASHRPYEIGGPGRMFATGAGEASHRPYEIPVDEERRSASHENETPETL